MENHKIKKYLKEKIKQYPLLLKFFRKKLLIMELLTPEQGLNDPNQK